MIGRFREEVYQSFEQRADGSMELVDALTSAVVVESPVAMSESPLFRREFSSIYDVLDNGKVAFSMLCKVLYSNQPPEAETMSGYEVYAVDCTKEPAPEAETLADRGQSRRGRHAPREVGHVQSWLVRLVASGSSWCMPLDVRRVPTSSSDSQVGSEQVATLASHESTTPKIVVADSLYCNAHFLAIFTLQQLIYALVRIRSNRVLYEAPPARTPNQRGRSRKHGDQFRLAAPSRTADQHELTTLFGQQVRLQAWEGLHFRELASLVGMVITVEFLKSDGTPRFKRPLYLFWTGPTTVPLVDLARSYLWRFAIEHMFRFLKQHLGLTVANSPNLEARLQWHWSCALAYVQLLLIRHDVAERRPRWHPTHVAGQARPLTPRQVQRAALPFLLALGTPAAAPKAAGKGRGRPLGYRPPPRTRYPVVKKGHTQRKTA